MSFEEYLKKEKIEFSQNEENSPFVYSLYYGYIATHEIQSLNYISQADLKRLNALEKFLSEEANPSPNNFISSVKSIPGYAKLLKSYPKQNNIFVDLKERGSLFVAQKINTYCQMKNNDKESQNGKEKQKSV